MSSRKDVFLSRVSVDKKNNVHPFAKELNASRISYWLDESGLVWGVIFSENFRMHRKAFL